MYQKTAVMSFWMKSLRLLEHLGFHVISVSPKGWTSSRSRTSPPPPPKAEGSNASQVQEGNTPQGNNPGEGEGDTLQPQLQRPISPLLRVPPRAASHPAATHTSRRRGVCVCGVVLPRLHGDPGPTRWQRGQRHP